MSTAITAIERAPWAITPDGLRTIIQVAERKGDIEAVQRTTGRELKNTRNVQIRDGVAIIPVVGPLFRYANLFTEISGATSYEVLAKDFTTALENRSVKGILLDIDSPGGEVIGCQETAELIFRARGTKPITAHVSGLGASGAYWIASAADNVIASSTAMLGSIGVVFAFRDTSKRDAQLGIEEVEIVSSQSPKKRPQLDSEAGQSQIQRWADDLGEVFVGVVARNRGVSVETVLKRFGAGDILVGSAAVKAGLADRISTLEDTLAAMAAGRDPSAALASVSDSAKPRAGAPSSSLLSAEQDQINRLLGRKRGGDPRATMSAQERDQFDRLRGAARSTAQESDKVQADAILSAGRGQPLSLND